AARPAKEEIAETAAVLGFSREHGLTMSVRERSSPFEAESAQAVSAFRFRRLVSCRSFRSTGAQAQQAADTHCSAPVVRLSVKQDRYFIGLACHEVSQMSQFHFNTVPLLVR